MTKEKYYTPFNTFIVAGTYFEGREASIRKFCLENTPIVLRRDKQNKHDKKAIQVFAIVKYKSMLLRREKEKVIDIGFVPKDHHEKDELIAELNKSDLIEAKILKLKLNKKSVKVTISFNLKS